MLNVTTTADLAATGIRIENSIENYVKKGGMYLHMYVPFALQCSRTKL